MRDRRIGSLKVSRIEFPLFVPIESVKLSFHELHPCLFGNFAVLIRIHHEQQLDSLVVSEGNCILMFWNACLLRPGRSHSALCDHQGDQHEGFEIAVGIPPRADPDGRSLAHPVLIVDDWRQSDPRDKDGVLAV
jgi:hypothetical protein